jgi:hypothetical protein
MLTPEEREHIRHAYYDEHLSIWKIARDTKGTSGNKLIIFLEETSPQLP